MITHYRSRFSHFAILLLTAACVVPISVNVAQADAIPPIPRKLPPQGKKLKAEVREKLTKKLNDVQQQLEAHGNQPFVSDVHIFTDAVKLALLHDEFYRKGDEQRANELLDLADQRLNQLKVGHAPWTDDTGLVVRGHRSTIDGSTQPYGLVIPESLDLSQPVPLYVWLHGRGDKTTNLAFIHQRQTSKGKIAPEHAIVLHPFGRQCIGFKSAGEIDVLEAIDHVALHYNIDRSRIVLMGFSMGGAGCWHLGAHYADRWVAMSPGAGFAETAKYQKLDPAQVLWYERQLWGNYDVPNYVRNLFNLPVIAYSGEKDKQIQAARVMEQAFASHGKKLNHKIGPGMGHKYCPQTLEAILKELKNHCDSGLNSSPKKVHLQTQTLRYNRLHWVNVQRLEKHWHDTRVDAELADEKSLRVTTSNVAALQLTPAKLPRQVDISIDGQMLSSVPTQQLISGERTVSLVKTNGQWANGQPSLTQLAKKPGLQGPIDDAFLEPFLVVLPSGQCQHQAVQQWVEFEQAHLLDRWRALYRGEARVKRDTEVTADDIANYHLVLWGDPTANKILSRIADHLPIRWNANEIVVGQNRYPASGHALVMVYPNPESPTKYVVLNSGPTFREGHDRTNSLQNPKLPDWAVFDLSQHPNALSAGHVVAAEFFDEHWQLDKQRQSPTP